MRDRSLLHQPVKARGTADAFRDIARAAANTVNLTPSAGLSFCTFAQSVNWSFSDVGLSADANIPRFFRLDFEMGSASELGPKPGEKLAHAKLGYQDRLP
jgi:hypothetical protein